MTKEYYVFHVYGTASEQNPGPLVRKENYPRVYNDSEITNGILSIDITSYGDAPNLAYVEIVAVDEHLGKRAFYRTVDEWRKRFNHAGWGV